MQNLTSTARLPKLSWLVALACFATLGACKKAKEVIVDAIGPEGSAKAGAAAPAEGTHATSHKATRPGAATGGTGTSGPEAGGAAVRYCRVRTAPVKRTYRVHGPPHAGSLAVAAGLLLPRSASREGAQR